MPTGSFWQPGEHGRLDAQRCSRGSPQLGDDSAIDELIRRGERVLQSRPTSLARTIGPSLGDALIRRSPPVPRRCSGDLAEEVIDAPTRPDVAGTIALCCGALVERGLDPTIALGPILDRLECQIAPEAIAFVAACRQAAEDEPPPPPRATSRSEKATRRSSPTRSSSTASGSPH